MYRLYFDELTKKYFIADEVAIDSRLVILKNRLYTPGGSFTVKEYLEAIGLKPNIPKYNNKRYTKKDFKYRQVFSMRKEYVDELPVIFVNIISQKMQSP